jgi:hypothetical protein
MGQARGARNLLSGGAVHLVDVAVFCDSVNQPLIAAAHDLLDDLPSPSFAEAKR